MTATGIDGLLDVARRDLPPDARPAVDELAVRRQEPLRIAIAGRVKAGKSTLLNALVGERLAPTGVEERTRLVTSYRWGHAPVVEAIGRDGAATRVPFQRVDGVLEPRLGDPLPEWIDRLEVAWPTGALRSRTLVDTPGLGGSADAGARTEAFLGLDPDEPRRADAVLYLLRHQHRDDLSFLEAFHEDGLTASPVTAIAVLSRADLVGGGDIDALEVAASVAAHRAADPLLRPLCQTVVPVCGLLAEASVTLTQPETQVLLDLATAPAEVLSRALRSVDDLRDPDAGVDPDPAALAGLLDRLGLYGVRVGCAAVRAGARAADEVAAALRSASGIDGLLATIERVFITRAAVLRDHSVLAGLNDLARRHRCEPLSHAVEAVVAADRSWRELEALVALRTSPDAFGADAAADADRLLGGQGDDPAVRLDVPAETSPEERRAAAYEALDRWQRRAARPLAPPAHVALADTVVRTLEAMLAGGLSDR